MRYYKLVYDFDNDDDYVILKSNSEMDIYDDDISNGKCISYWNIDTKFEYNEVEGKILSDYLAADNGWIVVSDRFCRIMSELFEGAVQYLDVVVANKTTNEEYNTFKVLNVINHLNALDLDNSKYDVFEYGDNKVLSVEKYVLKKSILKNLHIFKLSDETIPVFVSESVKKLIENSFLTGFQFVEVKTI